LAFNVNIPPLNDPRVRRALAMAIDRERLADRILAGNVLPAAGGVIPPGMIGHTPSVGPTYDPDHARQLLAEAGFPGGQGLPTINFGAFRPLIVNQICNQWQEQLNVTIRPDFLQSTVRAAHALRAGRISILHVGWICDCPDPDYILRVGMYDYASDHETYTALVEKARSLTEQNERLRLYRQAEQLLLEEVIVFPLLYGRTNLLVQPWVKQLPVSALKWWFFQDAVIQRPNA
jgi:oligopeptide transport system substrate-binding protein